MFSRHFERGVIIQLSLSLLFAPLRRFQNYRAEDGCSLLNRFLAALSEYLPLVVSVHRTMLLL